MPSTEAIRVRGLVQGVGFRPTVWRLATQAGLVGDVVNDGDGVLIRVRGPTAKIKDLCDRLVAERPPLARIDSLVRTRIPALERAAGFIIRESRPTQANTGIVPDAATCTDCVRDIFNPENRRYRYPFTNCTHCGPRLTIIEKIPYDRGNTSMSDFRMCPDCRREYEDPADRRFHAQPNACPVCGPSIWLVTPFGQRLAVNQGSDGDLIEYSASLLRQGKILAIKGIGGFHLACDARDEHAVARLRRRKRRFHKPFGLMVGDLNVAASYALVDTRERNLLSSPAAPIVLLRPNPAGPAIAPSVAPGQSRLGMMLPHSPLHHLLLANRDSPLVMTSGNLSEEPQCISNEQAVECLLGIADYVLLHNRRIVNRVDDSVVRQDTRGTTFFRRSRGYAPTPNALPDGFDRASSVLALGGQLKNTFCLVQNGRATVSQYIGDLEDVRAIEDHGRALDLYLDIFQCEPDVLAVDKHPNYHASRAGREWARMQQLDLYEVQHHHAHIASVLAEHGRPISAKPIVGAALDGTGYGDDGTIWGGEFLLADYRDFVRVACFSPARLLGGRQAVLEPWRNTLAHIFAHFGWQHFARRWPKLELTDWLSGKPIGNLVNMFEKGLNSPLTTSCGRLFDAVAAAVGICRDSVGYEGQAAVELESAALLATNVARGYPFSVEVGQTLVINPRPMWVRLFDDLDRGVGPATIALRFHQGVAASVSETLSRLCVTHDCRDVALSGGVFQNRLLLDLVLRELDTRGIGAMTQKDYPPNDAGLSFGQALVAAARHQAL